MITIFKSIMKSFPLQELREIKFQTQRPFAVNIADVFQILA